MLHFPNITLIYHPENQCFNLEIHLEIDLPVNDYQILTYS